jgi:hypothetical protein
MDEINTIGVTYDRDKRLHQGYLVLFPKGNDEQM